MLVRRAGPSIAKVLAARVNDVVGRHGHHACVWGGGGALSDDLFNQTLSSSSSRAPARPADVRELFLQLAQFSSNEILSHKMRSHLEKLRNMHRTTLDTLETYLAVGFIWFVA